jgi:hypothetical protein
MGNIIELVHLNDDFHTSSHLVNTKAYTLLNIIKSVILRKNTFTSDQYVAMLFIILFYR